MDFRTLPDAPVLRLDRLTAPACLLGRDGDLVTLSLTIAEGRLAGDRPDAVAVDMGGAMVLPAFVDMHTHLDKGHTAPRRPNPDGTFDGALKASAEDPPRWTRDDLRRRMDFALRCAFAHGTRALRTHLDSGIPQDALSWPLFEELRDAWAGRIALQAVALASPDDLAPGGPFPALADRVAAAGGVLGLVTFPGPAIGDRIDALLDHALARGLPIDLHVDETLDPAANTLRVLAERLIARRFDLPAVAGHLCSLATMEEPEALATLDLVARAGLHVVSLPLCNLYLQDRHPGRTPRLRGVTLVHEMKARGIPVSFASDNTRDPFYAYGDLDMLEVLREATRIAHLDHSDPDWVRSVLATPARACGFDAPSLAPGAPADLVLFRARSWTELLARPQSDRIVLRAGRPIDRTLPDHAELDDLMAPAG